MFLTKTRSVESRSTVQKPAIGPKARKLFFFTLELIQVFSAQREKKLSKKHTFCKMPLQWPTKIDLFRLLAKKDYREKNLSNRCDQKFCKLLIVIFGEKKNFIINDINHYFFFLKTLLSILLPLITEIELKKTTFGQV